MEREILKRPRRGSRRKACEVPFIQSLEEGERRQPRAEQIPISLMGKVLEVARSGYYAWKSRRESDRGREDAALTEAIKKIHHEHEVRLGIARIVVELAERGRFHSAKRVRRLARAADLACVHPRPYKATAVQDEANNTP